MLTRLTSAGESVGLCTETSQVERPVCTTIVLGAHVCSRVTSPCRLKNATGRCSSRSPLSCLRSIRPKYWPSSGASGAEIVISNVTWLPGRTFAVFGCTSIEVPGEDTVLVLKDQIPVRDVRRCPRRRDLTGHPRGVHRGRVEVDARQRRSPRRRRSSRQSRRRSGRDRPPSSGRRGRRRHRTGWPARQAVDFCPRRRSSLLSSSVDLIWPGDHVGCSAATSRGGAGKVRRRHGRARDRLEEVAGRPRRPPSRAVGVCGREDLEAGTGDVGLHHQSPSRAARREVGDSGRPARSSPSPAGEGRGRGRVPLSRRRGAAGSRAR